jgi:hypothetical protein
VPSFRRFVFRGGSAYLTSPIGLDGVRSSPGAAPESCLARPRVWLACVIFQAPGLPKANEGRGAEFPVPSARRFGAARIEVLSAALVSHDAQRHRSQRHRSGRIADHRRR